MHADQVGSSFPTALRQSIVAAEVGSPMIEVGAAAREVAHLHSAATQAAAVPIPPLLPAGPPPGGPAAANVPRPVIADLYSAGPVVFDPFAKGEFAWPACSGLRGLLDRAILVTALLSPLFMLI